MRNTIYITIDFSHHYNPNRCKNFFVWRTMPYTFDLIFVFVCFWLNKIDFCVLCLIDLWRKINRKALKNLVIATFVFSQFYYFICNMSMFSLEVQRTMGIICAKCFPEEWINYIGTKIILIDPNIFVKLQRLIHS